MKDRAGRLGRSAPLTACITKVCKESPNPNICNKVKPKDVLAYEDPKGDPFAKVPDISHLVSSVTLDIANRQQTSNH